MRIVVFITDAVPIERILTHIGESAKPPPISSAREPPGTDDTLDPLPDWDLIAQPEPELESDLRVCP
jgi:hypothetical protein